MSEDLQNKSVKSDLFSSFKKKLIDLGVDYVKRSFNFSKQDVAKYVEKYIHRTLERKVKKEIRKQTFKFAGYVLLGLGVLFIVYFILDLVVFLLNIPVMFTNLLFGLFLVLFGLVLFWLK